jgi:hypothetical protein
MKIVQRCLDNYYLENCEAVEPCNEARHNGLASATRAHKHHVSQRLAEHSVDSHNVIKQLVKNNEGDCGTDKSKSIRCIRDRGVRCIRDKGVRFEVQGCKGARVQVQREANHQPLSSSS